jgi:DNA mismatch repair protein MutL
MSRIHCLSDEIARQIAAGEVVERPASVVKELIENSLDARASSITIRIEDAGVGLVEVADDGCGMSAEDLVLAPMNFSTSKISTADDLNRIGTYGFRGEALSSISAVSNTTIVTSDSVAGEGWRLTAAGSDARQPVPSPRERGTTVQVRNLFYNTPARKKFLKSRTSERRRILETILSYAMIHPGVELHYIDEGRHVLDFLPVESWRDRVEVILGATTMKHMVEISAGSPGLSISGFSSLPTFTRANRNYQFLYVNDRLVKEKTIIHAMNEAYRHVIPVKRFPVVILACSISSEDVDVNVHPSKLEVRIRNERMIHETIRKAMRDALSARSEHLLEVHYNPGDRAGETDSLEGARMELPENPTESLFGGAVVREDGSEEPPDPPEAESNIISLQSRIRDAASLFMKKHLAESDLAPQLSLRSREDIDQVSGAVPPLSTRVSSDDGLFWQFNKSYIFIQVHGGLVIIDQHAAHERIIYDSSRRNVERAIAGSQQLLFPIHLELSLSELEMYQTSRDLFEKLGFVLEPFGGKSILVRAYPQGLKNWGEGRLLLQIFDDLIQGSVPGNTHLEKVLASFACRSAVKAGQRLSGEEMRLLADQLFAVENPYSCPHGRPTIQRISLSQLEKWFQR